jgi:hypothetical protein
MVLAAMKSKGHTQKFKAFCKTDTMDSFLHACIDYFGVFFELRALQEEESAKNSAERRDALAEGKAPPAEPIALPTGPDAALLRAKELEKRARLRDIALVYSTILLAHSNFSNTQQERQFFESLYDFAKRVLFTINNRKHCARARSLDRITGKTRCSSLLPDPLPDLATHRDVSAACRFSQGMRSRTSSTASSARRTSTSRSERTTRVLREAARPCRA